ncbi:hypothetical protein ACJMK2_009629 [Sinanodonta woodiana]|uniref:Uncharacterized protein n=1 Tax=Sinanodonta woodiana TaxID=1069815 RepID=A0ABD3VE27_SINWO
MEVPDYYDVVSVRLMKVLDSTELTEKIRWKRVEMWTQVEELLTIARSKNKRKYHIFGSQAEATTTSGLRSDIDIVSYLSYETALRDLHSWKPGSRAALMIWDDTTPPGYVKLQQVFDDLPVPMYNIQTERLMLDMHGRSCIYNNTRFLKPDRYLEHHGPALTMTKSQNSIITSYDFVYAYRSHSWPYTASGWIPRHREHNWPSQEIISLIQLLGALLVPVGHTLSPERQIKWRISLSYGEKILVWQFNSTKYKFYIVLKMINKYFIKKRFGENVLTSYHWKTYMFYMIETTPTVLWQPQNLLRCIELCLMKVCTWIEECNCPNYFIPAENMFLDKVNGHVQRKLANMLHDLLRQKGRYLTMIPYDGIGQKLCIACQSSTTLFNDETNGIVQPMVLAVRITFANILVAWFKIVLNGFKITLNLFEQISSHPVRQEICTILQKFCCSNIGSLLAS